MREIAASPEPIPAAPGRRRAPTLREPRRRRLVDALVLTTALPLTLLTLAIGGIGLWNSQRTATALAAALGDSISERVRLQLDQLMAAPRQINTLNSRAIAEGRLDPADFDQMAATFISQMKVFPVGYINYASQEGDFIGIERLDDGGLRLNLTDRRRGASRQFVFAIGEKGPEPTPLKVYEQMSPATEEAWYTETVAAGAPTWSSIYQWDDKPQVLSVSFNEPVRLADGRLRGVIGIDFILSQLNNKLAAIWGGRPGAVLICERNGLLVASSLGDTVRRSAGQTPERRSVFDSQSELVREVAPLVFRRGLRQGEAALSAADLRPGALSGGRARQLRSASSYVQVMPWSDSHGLDWLVLVVIPSSSLTSGLHQQTLFAALLCLITLAVLLLATRRLTGWILRPLQELSDRAGQLGAALRRTPGQTLSFEPRLEPGTAQEIATLSGAMASLIASFNGQVTALRRSGNRLQREVEQKARALDSAVRKEAEAVATNASRERFLGHLGETMLPLLASLLGNTRLARNAPPEAAEAMPRRLAAIDSVGRQLQEMAQDLRDYARLGSGSLALRSQPFALQTVLEEVAGAARPHALDRGIALHLTVDPAMPERLRGDPERLKQVLRHLLANAIRFSAAGATVELRAHGRWDGPEPQLILAVADQGSGFDPERIENALLADMNEVRQGSRAGSGAGLGLPLCRRLVRLMHGDLQISGTPGQGTTVTLTLPCDPAD